MPHASGLSRQNTLPAEDPLWSYQPAPGPGRPAPIPSRNEPLLFIPNHTTAAHDDTLKNLSQSRTPTQRSFRFVDMPHASGLSRQNTLPAEDPLWSYQPAPGPGRPAPIPRRNELLLFISNHTAAAHDDTLKNLSQDHLFPGEGDPRIETLKAYSTNPGHHSDGHAVLNFYHGPCCSGLNDDSLPLATMASLTIHETNSLQPSGAYSSNVEAHVLSPDPESAVGRA